MKGLSAVTSACDRTARAGLHTHVVNFVWDGEVRCDRASGPCSQSVDLALELTVGQRDVVLVDSVPLLELDLCSGGRVSQAARPAASAMHLRAHFGRMCASLRRNQLLEVPDSVVRRALHSDCEQGGHDQELSCGGAVTGARSPFRPRRSLAITSIIGIVPLHFDRSSQRSRALRKEKQSKCSNAPMTSRRGLGLAKNQNRYLSSSA